MASQRIVFAVTAMSDANGKATFTVPPPDMGFVQQGSVVVTNAPSGALFTGTVANTPWGQWAGPTNFGPVQQYTNEVFSASAVGLQANTQYNLQFVGIHRPEWEATAIPPVAPLSTVSVETTTVLLSNFQMDAVGGQSQNFTPPSLTRRLTILLRGTSAGVVNVLITGFQTGHGYYNQNLNVTGDLAFDYVAIEPGFDQTYSITVTSGSTSVKVWILASVTNPEVQLETGEVVTINGNPGTSVAVVPVTIKQQFGQITQAFQGAISTNTANQTLVAAPVASTSIYLESITFSVDATTGPIKIAFGYGTAGVMSQIIGYVTLVGGGWDSQTITFPHTFELPTNNALMCTTTPAVTATNLNAAGTYKVSNTQT